MGSKYAASFTTGGLFHRESLLLVEQFLRLENWQRVCAKVSDENLLQLRAGSSSKRVYREIESRLKTLTLAEMSFLLSGSHHDQAYLLWVAVCRHYQLVGDFAIEVLRERFTAHNTTLGYDDFDAFFNRKAEWHPELDQLAESTRKKLRQVLFRMLREANLLSGKGEISAALLGPELMNLMIGQARRDFAYLPMPEHYLSMRAE